VDLCLSLPPRPGGLSRNRKSSLIKKKNPRKSSTPNVPDGRAIELPKQKTMLRYAKRRAGGRAAPRKKKKTNPMQVLFAPRRHAMQCN
jgi:hypothetical protein